MKIAVIGTSSLLGKAVVKMGHIEGHYVIEVNPTPEDHYHPSDDGEQRTAEVTDFNALKTALKDAKAVIHIMPWPEDMKGMESADVHHTIVQAGYNIILAAVHQHINRVVFVTPASPMAMYAEVNDYKFLCFPLHESMTIAPPNIYHLSKTTVEREADWCVRAYPNNGLRIATLRMPEVNHKSNIKRFPMPDAFELWAWVDPVAAARACLLSVTAPEGAWKHHEVFFIAAPITHRTEPSLELCKEWLKSVKIEGDLSGNKGLYDTTKAAEILGWTHPETE